MFGRALTTHSLGRYECSYTVIYKNRFETLFEKDGNL